MLVRFGLPTDVLFFGFHEGHLRSIIIKTQCHVTLLFDVSCMPMVDFSDLETPHTREVFCDYY